MADIFGGWKLAAMANRPMPGPIKDFIDSMNSALKGATLVPVLYVGSQVVHGTNHMILCKQTLATKDAERHLIELVLNENHDEGYEDGRWSAVSITRIV